MKRFLLLVLVSSGLVACVPPPEQGGEPAAGGEASAAATCDSACAHFVECGHHADQAVCVDECHAGGFTPDVLATLESASCEQLGAWIAQGESAPADGGGESGGGAPGGGESGIFAGQGNACVGGDVCPGVNICCGDRGPAPAGEPGKCFSASICNMGSI